MIPGVPRTPQTPRSAMACEGETQRDTTGDSSIYHVVQTSPSSYFSMLLGMGPGRKVTPVSLEDYTESTPSDSVSVTTPSKPAPTFSGALPQSLIGAPLYFATSPGGKVVVAHRKRDKEDFADSSSLEAIAAEMALQVAQVDWDRKFTHNPSVSLLEEELEEEES